MSKVLSLSKIAAGVAALTLSSSIWASTANMMWDPVNATMRGTGEVIENFDTLGVRHAMSGPVYIITDKMTGTMREMDGIKCGKVISDTGHMVVDEESVVGDTITDMRTHRSGVITGIKSQGTMEVTHKNGKTVQYQYVTFKIHPEK